ncbi:MAG: hypothetical protein MK193_15130 [Lentisphaeria bacterium]|nr:hypothetical protein [Lentisphaeria bacterium]
MKIYGIPGWACENNYFDFLSDANTFDWHFYSEGKPNPDEYISNISEEFIFICYSMGSLYIPQAINNEYCKGIISLSGFLNFCGDGKLSTVLKSRISEMQAELKSRLIKTVSDFNIRAGSSTIKKELFPEYVNLNRGLNRLKDHETDTYECKLPLLLLRGKKDTILHPKVAIQLEREFPNAEAHCINDAAHDLANSTEAVDHIRYFIDELS